jgi:hypothetical protein
MTARVYPLADRSQLVPRADWLLPLAYDVKVTRLDKPAFNLYGKRGPGEQEGPPGAIRTNPLNFQVVPLEPMMLATGNNGRKSFFLQNKDPTDNLFFSFGTEAGPNSAYLSPGQYILLDFVCPTDSVWVYGTVAVAGSFYEFAPLGG